jgi:hypothetical protein
MNYINVGKENLYDVKIYYKDWGQRTARSLQSWLANFIWPSY